MKKVCGFVFSVMFLFANQDVLAKDVKINAPQKNAKGVEVGKQDMPTFPDIYSIMTNKNVQDSVRFLQFKVLKLLKDICRTTRSDETSTSEVAVKGSNKDTLNEIRGSKKDIDQAQRRVNYLTSLESNLEKADSLAQVKNLLGLNLSGKEEVQKALDLIESVEAADTLQKVRDIPRIDKKINEVIDRYETLEQSVLAADSIEKIKEIPDINPKFVEEIQTLENQVAEIKSLEDADRLVESSSISNKLKDQISDLLNLDANFKDADTLEKLKKLPNTNPKIVEYVETQVEDNQKLNQQVQQLQKEVSDLNYRLENVTTDAEKERRFSTALIGAILRALIGFDYRNKMFDFAKTKKLKVAEKSAQLAAAKNSFSHLGGSEEDLCTITNGLHQILKVLISQKNWMEKIVSIKRKLEAIAELCKRFNGDADIIRVNVDYAINIISHMQEGARRPPRDNIQNFDTLAEQGSGK